MILVDSEGLDSPHVPQHYNWLISAVTLLMSDVFMYQTKASIEQSAADRLDMILKVAEQLQKAGKGQDCNEYAARGNFMWLLRDHQLQMKRTPREELVEMLDPAQVRTLKRVFADFDCVPLPRPARDEVLKNLDHHDFQDLSPDFREEFVVLERRLLQILGEPRDFFGNAMTGKGLAEVLSLYLSAIKQQKGVLGDICQMPTQRELVKQLVGKRAVKAGTDRYEHQLRKAGLKGPDASTHLPVRPAELLAAHGSARAAAVEACSDEVGAAGLEEEEAREVLANLEELIASWAPCFELADAGSDLDDHGSCDAPCVVRSTRLRGGLLCELWGENAQRSKAAYEAWLQELEGTASDSQGAASLEEHYTKFSAALANVADETRTGPWGALHATGAGGKEQRRVLLSAARQGDRILLATMQSAQAEARASLAAQLEELCAEQLEERRKELKAALLSASAESQRLVEAADARHEAATAEMAAALKAAEAEREAAHHALEDTVAKRFADFEQRLSEMAAASVQSLEQAAADMHMQIRESSEAVQRIGQAAVAEHARQIQNDLDACESRALEANSTMERRLQAELVRNMEDAENRWQASRETDLEAQRVQANETAGEFARTQELLRKLEEIQQQVLQQREEDSNRTLAAVAHLEEVHQNSQQRHEDHEQLLKQREDDCRRISDAFAPVAQNLQDLDQKQGEQEHLLKQREDDCRRISEAVARLDESQQRLHSDCRRMLEENQQSLHRKDDADRQLAELDTSLRAFTTTQIQPLEERLGELAGLAGVESRLGGQLENQAFEYTKAVELRLETNIARSQQRVEQQLDTKLTEVRLELAKGIQVMKENLESDHKQLKICMEDRERITNFMKSSDLDSMWESFAIQASRLSEVQCTLDDFIFRQNGCRPTT